MAVAGILPSVEKGNSWAWLVTTNYGKVFVFGLILSTVGGLVSIISTPGNQKLQDETRRLKKELARREEGYSKILNDELKLLFQIINFGNNERISLYKHEEQENSFIMIARYSSNPNLKKPGRVFYPDNQGCIGKAWEHKSSFVDNLPEPDTPKYYQILNSDWNIDEQTAKRMTMKSRTISAFSISNADEERIAVLVFESTRIRGFKENHIQNIMTEGEEKRIALLLKSIVYMEPDPIYALQENL